MTGSQSPAAGGGRRIWVGVLCLVAGACAVMAYIWPATRFNTTTITRLPNADGPLIVALTAAMFGFAAAGAPNRRPERQVFGWVAVMASVVLVVLMWRKSVGYHRGNTNFSNVSMQWLWVAAVILLVATILLMIPSRIGVPIAFVAGVLTVLLTDPRLKGDGPNGVGAFNWSYPAMALLPGLTAGAFFALRAIRPNAWWATIAGLLCFIGGLTLGTSLQSHFRQEMSNHTPWIAPLMLLPLVMIGCEIVWGINDRRARRAATAATPQPSR